MVALKKTAALWIGFVKPNWKRGLNPNRLRFFHK